MSEPRRLPSPPPRTADSNRQKRRALMKAVGRRQFKKLYRQAKDGHGND